MAKTDTPTTIKKYANRRLYNTGTSTYVTLEDLASMVKDGEDFLVYDAKTGDDDVGIAVDERLIAQGHRAQTTSAQLIDAPGRAFHGNAG